MNKFFEIVGKTIVPTVGIMLIVLLSTIPLIGAVVVTGFIDECSPRNVSDDVYIGRVTVIFFVTLFIQAVVYYLILRG